MARAKKTPTKTTPKKAKAPAKKAPAKKAPAKKRVSKKPAEKKGIIPSPLVDMLSKRLDKIESKNGMVSNTVKYLRPQSFGILMLDLLFNGGLYPGFCSLSGKEQSGKTISTNHAVANSLSGDQLFTFFIDGEGALSPELAGSIYSTYGVSYDAFVDSQEHSMSRYYRDNVIERVFDMQVAFLKSLPDRVWSEKAKTWAYVFKKKDQYQKTLMEAYGVKPDKDLNTEYQFLCPTDNDKSAGIICIDSLASLVTERDDDEESRSKIRAAEAQAFSNQLKRVSARLSSTGTILLGTNQLRTIPGQTYGDPNYEPGGDALKFYSHQRARLTSRVSGFTSGLSERDKDGSGFFLEPSVFGAGLTDQYMFKSIKNTKNKPGNPNRQGWIRVWVGDHTGKPRGIDPFYDVYMYLLATKQLKKKKGARKGNLTFKLKKGVSKNSMALNECKGFGELELKALVLAEFFNDRGLLKEMAESFGFSKAPKLRESLFLQMQKNPEILSNVKELKTKKKDDDFDAEEL